MVSKSARKLWEKGIPLSEAWLAFADDALNSQFANTRGFAAAINHFAYDKPMPDLKTLIQTVSIGLNAKREKDELVDAMKDDLLDQLFNSQLVATGYRESPSRSSSPVVIHADQFDEGIVDWNGSKFSTTGLAWGRIRIGPLPIDPASKTKGSRPAIRAAIAELLSEGLNLNSLSLKVGAEFIREKLGRKYEKGNGLSDVNLAKIIREICGSKGIS